MSSGHGSDVATKMPARSGLVFHERDSAGASLSYQESVDQALCFGRIDGVRRAVNASAHLVIRFTPRRPTVGGARRI